MKKLVVCLLAVTMVLCMSFAVISVSAADSELAPSIEAKPVPESIQAVIGEEAVTVTLVSYKDAAEGSDLAKAYKALKESGVKATITNIDKFVSENLKINNAKYYVSNIFDLSLSDADNAKLEGDGSVTVTFKNDATINAKAGKLVVAHMVDNQWVIVPNKDVKVTAETVEVTFDDLCPVAFLHVEEGEATPAPGDDAEDDGLLTATIIILSITAVIILGIVVFYILEKKGIIGNAAQNNSKKK